MSSFNHLKLPLIDIINATNDFSDENIIRREIFGNDYKGKLLMAGQLIDVVVARRFNFYLNRQGSKELQNEILMLDALKHQNIVSIVGFCDEYGENIIVNKFEAKGSLHDYLSDPVTLTWAKRLYICLGMARALSCIHYEQGRSFSVIHRDIKSSRILLGDNWEAKLSGFELSTMQPAGQRDDVVHLDGGTPRGTHEYLDPANFSIVSHKSDVYSLGVVLFEVLSGKKAYDHKTVPLATLAKSSFENQSLGEIIHPDLLKEMDQESLKIFSKAAYSCLNEQPSQRPDIDHLTVEFKRALELQLKHENSVKDWQHLKIGFREIKRATQNFDGNCCIGEGSYGKVYKAKLEHFESSAMEGDIPRRVCSTVAIKMISEEKGIEGEEGFKAEINTLSSCKHANIISLLGFCHEPSRMILVYEHVSNGSLDDWLINKEKIKLTCSGGTRQNVQGSPGHKKYVSGVAGDEKRKKKKFFLLRDKSSGVAGTTSGLKVVPPMLTWVQRLNICIDIARGLDYLHTTTYYKREIIHSDIKSANILLGENWEAKIADFGLSRFHPRKDMKSTILTNTFAGTEVYLDPEYERTGRLKKESDVYSFGVVLFEILTGRLAYDSFYTTKKIRGLAPVVRKHLKANAKLNELVDPMLREERDEENFTLSKGPDQDSLRTFCDIGRQCLAKEQVDRPTMKVVINKLEKALHLQETRKDNLRISFEDIRSATQDFNLKNLIGNGEFGMLYKGEILRDNESTPIVVNRSNISWGQGEKEFLKKLATLFDCNHPNIIGLVGYCSENNERISVFEYASNGSLDTHLKDATLTWTKRLKIAIDVATGLNFLHGDGSTQASVIHRDIKSSNILLNSDWKAKITDFGLSMITVTDDQFDSVANDACGTSGYVDPLYINQDFLTRESDLYSLGVVLFEMMCGRTAYILGQVDLVGLVKYNYEAGKLDELVFEDIRDEIVPESLTIFQQIAYKCLVIDKEARPTASNVVSQLTKALKYQDSHKETHKETGKENRQISFEDIRSATQNFKNIIGRGGFGGVYKGEISSANGPTTIAVKRQDPKYAQGVNEFMTELKILSEYKHENIVDLLGYCNENDERILVYKYASNGSLDKYLNDVDLTWTKRLKICIEVAIALQFLHEGGTTKDVVIHRDIKPHNILLNEDWKAKITDFGLSTITYDKFDFVVDDACGTAGYCDPEYMKTNFLTTESDIYSLGVVLVEMMYGRLAYYQGSKSEQLSSFEFRSSREVHTVPKPTHYSHPSRYSSAHYSPAHSRPVNTNSPLEYIVPLFRREYEHQTNDYFFFKDIKDKIAPKSLTIYQNIAYRCLHDERRRRPPAREVVSQLQKALEVQEDYEIRGTKLSTEKKQITQMSKSPKKLYSDVSNNECSALRSINEARNDMESETMFSYENRKLNKRRSIKKSRIQRMMKMMDISNLKIRIKIKTQTLSPNVIYGAYLVFKFCEPRKLSSKQMYVNLKYQMGSETLHAYFATCGDDKWMTIELCRVIPHKKDVDFEVLLESLSRYYCGSGAIYVEGIHFRAISDATLKAEVYEDLKGAQGVLKSNSDSVQQVSVDYDEITQLEDSRKLFSPSKVNEKNCHMLPAKMVLYESSTVKCFNWKSLPEPEARYLEVAELLSHQVFRIKCKIETQKLSPDTDYACHLIFELSQKCHGLQCPVRVQDVLHRKNKESKFLYFRSPRVVNLHGVTSVPKHREDGLMEVVVWEFNSGNKLSDGYLPVNLKLRCYEGTMSGLIVYGIEFRPV